MRTLINIVGFILLVGFFSSVFFAFGWAMRARIYENQPRKLPAIEEIQRQIGCEKIDGIWGPETNELYEKFICNQYATECFEGEPK